MSGLDYEVWDDPVQKNVRILVSHRREDSPESSLTSADRAPAAMWNLRLAESVGDGATDAVVVTDIFLVIKSAHRYKYERLRLKTQENTEIARSAAGISKFRWCS
jgi:hypothetical protein